MGIQEIKQKLSIGTVLAHFKLKPDKNNRLNCAFHKDKTPSMQVYPETNTVYCFSSNCQTHGKSLDVIDFIMYKEGISKHEALKKGASLILTITTTPTNPMKTEPSNEKSFSEIFRQLQNNISKSPQAKAYLQSRNIDSAKLEIGYNASNYKDLKHCIVFPLRDKNNNTVGFYGRSLYNNTDQKHYYLKDRAGIYPGHPKQNTEKLIITEAIIDAASLLQIKSINENYSIISAFGANGLNEEIKESIITLKNLQEIIFAFDNDDAGNTAVEKYSEELKMDNGQLIISKIELPCKDVNETLQAHEPEIFTHLLETRTFIFSDEKPTEKEKQSPEQAVKLSTSRLNTSNPEQITYNTNELLITLLGGINLQNLDRMRVTLYLRRNPHLSPVYSIRQTIDLYHHDAIEKFARQASEKTDISTSVIIAALAALTEELEHYRLNEVEKKINESQTEPVKHILTAEEKSQAMQLANDKNLMDKFKELLTLVGIVGEDENKVFAMTVAISSQFFNPLNCLIQGSSGSGKTNLMKLVCSCMPDGIVKMYTRVSDKMLYHVGANYFVRKVVCFHDVDSLSEEVALIVRELISNGDINTGITYKDDKGNIATKELIVNGPLTTFACTTRGAMYLDNMTRVLIIVMDESEVQTERIIERYLQKSNNQLSGKEEQTAIKQLQNFIQILKPYEVYNPYSNSLKLPSKLRDRRRLQMLYIHYVDTITNIFQYQRKKTSDGKLIAVKDDCLLAFRLMFDCILIKLDELDGSLRQFYERLKEWVKVKSNGQLKGFSFTQREIRQELNINNQSLKRYMTDLLDLEYISIKSGGISGSTNKYEIYYWDDYGKMKAGLKEEMIKQIDDLEEKV